MKVWFKNRRAKYRKKQGGLLLPNLQDSSNNPATSNCSNTKIEQCRSPDFKFYENENKNSVFTSSLSSISSSSPSRLLQQANEMNEKIKNKRNKYEENYGDDSEDSESDIDV